MAFMLYERAIRDGHACLLSTGEGFSLAGYNLIYRAWEKHNRPIDKGWHVSADDLIRIGSDGVHSAKTRCLLIDFDPKSTKRIGIIELLDVYAYTFGNDGDAGWTPLMLKLRDIFYEESPTSPAEREARLQMFVEPEDSDEFVEFLYLNGVGRGWNWGKNGMTNAAFIQGEAREYFRKFF